MNKLTHPNLFSANRISNNFTPSNLLIVTMLSQSFYDQDFHQWLKITIDQLEQPDFSHLDVDRLIEELQDLGKSDKNALESNLVILLAHLLKVKVQANAPDSMQKSWFRSIIEHRERLSIQLENIPSLKSYLPTLINSSYLKARKLAIKESKLALWGSRRIVYNK